MSTSIVPYTLKILNSHVEVTLHPPVTEVTWTDLEKLGTEVLSELQSRKQPICLIDLTELSYMGSSMVALLVRIWKDVKAQNGKMVVVTDHALVKEIITLAGLDKIWTMHPTPEIARKSLGLPSPGGQPSSSVGKAGKVLIAIVVITIAVIGIGVFTNQISLP